MIKGADQLTTIAVKWYILYIYILYIVCVYIYYIYWHHFLFSFSFLCNLSSSPPPHIFFSFSSLSLLSPSFSPSKLRWREQDYWMLRSRTLNSGGSRLSLRQVRSYCHIKSAFGHMLCTRKCLWAYRIYCINVHVVKTGLYHSSLLDQAFPVLWIIYVPL